ncbi:hypothetical protein CPB84DRAFT_1797182 [Gymnopilus junonius]|uniref:Uncharacterized protein n=1 Tax=Gymnopilus junonius TaxID=109634 RepID=A0A9P5NC13_GYMJU|nr:hypothetical protein CPB84DRAFT_1797182 [Gymnopilus junonius]
MSCLTLASIPMLFTLHLTSLCIAGLLQSVSKADCAAIIHAWPLMTSLELFSPVISFDCLIELASGLPNLNNLKLNVDCKDPPVIQDIPILSSKVSTLEFYYKSFPPKDPFHLAACLDRLFPEINSQINQSTGKDKWKWEQTIKLLEIQQRSRKIRE